LRFSSLYETICFYQALIPANGGTFGSGGCHQKEIKASPRQAAGNVLPETAVLGGTVRIKRSIFSSLANPAIGGGKVAHGCGSGTKNEKPYALGYMMFENMQAPLIEFHSGNLRNIFTVRAGSVLGSNLESAAVKLLMRYAKAVQQQVLRASSLLTSTGYCMPPKDGNAGPDRPGVAQRLAPALSR